MTFFPLFDNAHIIAKSFFIGNTGNLMVEYVRVIHFDNTGRTEKE